MVPKPIHRHAGSKRIGGIEHPLGQLPATGRFHWPRRLSRAVDRLQKAPGRNLSGAGGRALEENALLDAIAIQNRGRRRRHQLGLRCYFFAGGSEGLSLAAKAGHCGAGHILQPRTGQHPGGKRRHRPGLRQIAERAIAAGLHCGGKEFSSGLLHCRAAPRLPLGQKPLQRIEPLRLGCRFHHLRHLRGPFLGGEFDMHQMALVAPQIVANPLPLPLGIDRRERADMERTKERYMAVNHGEDLQMAPHAIPEHSLFQTEFGRAQHAPGPVEFSLLADVEFAGRFAFCPDGITARRATSQE